MRSQSNLHRPPSQPPPPPRSPPSNLKEHLLDQELHVYCAMASIRPSLCSWSPRWRPVDLREVAHPAQSAKKVFHFLVKKNPWDTRSRATLHHGSVCHNIWPIRRRILENVTYRCVWTNQNQVRNGSRWWRHTGNKLSCGDFPAFSHLFKWPLLKTLQQKVLPWVTFYVTVILSAVLIEFLQCSLLDFFCCSTLCGHW